MNEDGRTVDSSTAGNTIGDADAGQPSDSLYELRCVDLDPTEIPRLYPDLPAIGGAIRTLCEDFDVTEIPLYNFSGEGPHLYLTIRKINRTSLQARDHLAKFFGVRPDDVGFAGFKDKRAVAQQTFSVPIDVPDLREAEIWARDLETSWLQILDVTRHRNKIRTGHLAGNRFQIKIRKVEAESLSVAEEVMRRISRDGLPNFYGPQRFGMHGVGCEIGGALLRRDVQTAIGLLILPQRDFNEPFRDLVAEQRYGAALEALPPGRSTEAALLHSLKRHPGNMRAAARRIPRQLRKMYYSAYQSKLFNWVLRERLLWGDGALTTLQTGDLAYIHGKGACFAVLDPKGEQARCDTLEISPSGPMFGKKVSLADGDMGRLERTVLATEGLRRESFVSHVKGLALDGGRRPLRVPVEDAEVRWLADEDALMVSFRLPTGVFATTLLEQIMGPGRTGFYPGQDLPSGTDPNGADQNSDVGGSEQTSGSAD